MFYYIGYSSNEKIRYNASSGGIGTTIIKYLLESGRYGSSMTFVFNERECMYEPKLIYNFSEYNNCGSIYQEIDNVQFIKEHLKDIRNGIVVTCMPCQVNVIRNILNKNNIKNFIISLCCSGQTTIQGTWFYYKLLDVKKTDVKLIQYRGKGWPSGIQITMKNGDVITKDNYTYPWTLMHKSLLYRPKRCLYCTFKTNPNSDVSLADPWLKEYIENDKIGNSVIICNSEGQNVLRNMIKTGWVILKEVEEDVYVKSQVGTIEIKAQSNRYKSFNKIVEKMGADGSMYKKIVTSSVFLLKLHLKLLKKLHKIV